MKAEHMMAASALGKAGVNDHDGDEAMSHMTVHPAMHKGGEGYVVHHHKSAHEMPHEGQKHMVKSMAELKAHMAKHAPMMHGMPEGGDGGQEEAIA